MKIIFNYGKREKWLFAFGIVTLFLGSATDFMVPAFVG